MAEENGKLMLNNLINTKLRKKKLKWWEEPEFKKEQIKKMERNKKASEKRRDKKAIRDYEIWSKSGYRTY